MNCIKKAEQPSERLRRHGFYATRPASRETARVVEIHPLGAFVLRLSTGALSVGEMVEQFASVYKAEPPLPAESLCISIIEALTQGGLLTVYRTRSGADSAFDSEAMRAYSYT